MGIGMFSSCSHGTTKKIVEKIVEKPVYINQKLPNPDPRNFIILKTETINSFTIALIKYPDCTNFEGVKIMVYKDIKEKDILKSKFLDPHFCVNKLCNSPIARFEPTLQGWSMAVNFCRNWK